MPSRERAELAQKSLESLGNGRYEVLIAVDHDDPQKEEYLKLANKKVRVYEFERFGYEQLWVYYNGLALYAKGDWLMLWNDDAIMEPGDWIDYITNYNHQKPLVLNPYHPIDNLFPILSRAWYKLIGHYSLSSHVDSWVQEVGRQANNQIHIQGVSIKHEGEKLNDKTHARVREVVKDTSEYHRSEEAQTLRENEAKILVEALIKGGFRNADNN